jgi:hypothetical protein
MNPKGKMWQTHTAAQAHLTGRRRRRHEATEASKGIMVMEVNETSHRRPWHNNPSARSRATEVGYSLHRRPGRRCPDGSAAEHGLPATHLQHDVVQRGAGPGPLVRVLVVAEEEGPPRRCTPARRSTPRRAPGCCSLRTWQSGGPRTRRRGRRRRGRVPCRPSCSRTATACAPPCGWPRRIMAWTAAEQ